MARSPVTDSASGGLLAVQAAPRESSPEDLTPSASATGGDVAYVTLRPEGTVGKEARGEVVPLPASEYVVTTGFAAPEGCNRRP